MKHLRHRGTGPVNQLTARMYTAAYMRKQRGVTMIEYVLMAAIAVTLAIVLRAQLSSIFSTLINNIKGQVSSTN